MNFTIDRTKWICGCPEENDNKSNCLGRGNTELINFSGFMCCLGQVALQLGIPKNKVNRKSIPSEITHTEYDKDTPLCCWNEGVYCHTDLANVAMGINDDKATTVKEKEMGLKELFKGCCHEIEFIN